MSFGDFPHDIGEAGITLGGSELEGADECWEADSTNRYGSFSGAQILWVEPIEVD